MRNGTGPLLVRVYGEFYFPKPNDWINSNGIRLIREDRFHENLSKHDDENDEIKELFENSSSYFNKLFWAEEIKSKCNKPSNLIDLFNNIKYHFVNQHFLGNFKDYPINPINNNFGYIGGITFESKGILTKQVKTKKDENESSCVVLVTFGTAILPFRRHQQYRNAMFTVFEHFGNCIFKVRIRTDKISYNNIEITNEKLPQQDILAKENTKLLISHCGQNSLNEAMYAGVPLICIPDGGDQFYNASLVEHLGIGIYIKVNYEVQLDHNAFGYSLAEGIFNILNKNSNYRKNAQILRENILKTNFSMKEFFLQKIAESISD
uniref:glucuronosyltransferase n=1 Tax=Meloidogyne hapla TaxID=6305 RepID=A0A1I8BWW1_MELHA